MTDRLNDPAEEAHFHYPLDEVLALVDEDPPAGPEGPGDDRVRVNDFISADIAFATAAYTAAQAAYLAAPDDTTRAAYDAAKQTLAAARQAHRANRAGLNIAAIRAPRAGE